MTSRQRLMLAVTHKHVCASQTVRLLVRRYQRQTAARWMGAVRKGEREQACTARVAEGWYFRHGVRARHNGSTLAVSLVGTGGWRPEGLVRERNTLLSVYIVCL